MVVFGLPKSCLRVLEVLHSCKSEFSQKDIATETGLSVRSVKYALSALEARGLILSLFQFNDARRKLYTAEGIAAAVMPADKRRH